MLVGAVFLVLMITMVLSLVEVERTYICTIWEVGTVGVESRRRGRVENRGTLGNVVCPHTKCLTSGRLPGTGRHAPRPCRESRVRIVRIDN